MDLEALRAIARGGLVSTAQAEAAGIDRRELPVAARRGQLTNVSHGWYATETNPSPTRAHALRTVAAVLGCEGRAASHHSGLVLRDLPTFHAPLHTVRVVATTARRRPTKGVRVLPRRSIHVEQVPFGPHVVPCLPTATCIIQSGLAEPISGLVSADAALAARLIDRGDLDRALAEVVGHRGVRELRRVLEWADARHESPGESRMCHSLHRLGYDYDPQVWIGQDRVDGLLRAAPVVMEFDGALKYASKEDLLHEKRREDRIRARGYDFVRCDWNDVDDLPHLDARIRAAMARVI